MRTFQGKAVNVEHSVLGRIIRFRNWYSYLIKKDPYILVMPKSTRKFPKATGYLVAGSLIDISSLGGRPCVYGLSEEELLTLQEGDVVLLSKDGNVKVVYEINSSSNAIFATNRCNLRCVMCPQSTSLDQENFLELNLSLIRLMDPGKTKSLAITGGEPTLLCEELFELIRACKKYLPRTALILLSNGTRFKDLEFARSLARVDHPDLVIAIALYADNDKDHDNIVGVSGSFYKTIKGLHNLSLLRQKVEIRTVIHALNYKRLPKFVEFIYHNFPFAIHVALMTMETIEIARENIERLWIDPYEYVLELEKAVRYLNRCNINVSIYNHQLCLLPQKLWPFSRKSISSWKNIYLDACTYCAEKERCGGFFATAGNCYSKYINPINY
ncbi:MAG: His-Xaa-Ser system radical SAM maturase HxsC [Candidatus Edwardsbacteria bacterium]